MSQAAGLKVGFIGLGIMGRHMAGHLQRAGHQLHVYNRSPGGADALAERIAAAAAARGVNALDAPVSGGDVGARDAALSIMVGGTQAAFDQAAPLLRAMGRSVVLQGGPGCGQHTKMCNQIVIASTMVGVCEGLAYAVKDLGIAVGEATRMALPLPGLELAKRLYDRLADDGHGREGMQALFRQYRH